MASSASTRRSTEAGISSPHVATLMRADYLIQPSVCPDVASLIRATLCRTRNVNRMLRKIATIAALMAVAAIAAHADDADCESGRCHHSAVMNADWLPDEAARQCGSGVSGNSSAASILPEILEPFRRQL